MKKLTTPILIAYGGLAIPLAALGLPLAVYIPPFYAGPIGLGVGTVGIIFMIARFWDIFTDPIMGMIVDRYPSRWGKRKHWIAIGVPVLMLASWFIFFPGGNQSPFYIIIWLFILYLAFTFVGLTQQAWGVDISKSYNDRSKVYGWREIGSIFGMMSVLALPAILENAGSSEKLRRTRNWRTRPRPLRPPTWSSSRVSGAAAAKLLLGRRAPGTANRVSPSASLSRLSRRSCSPSGPTLRAKPSKRRSAI